MTAASKSIQTSDFGTELEDKYNSLIEVISEKYGAPGTKFNVLKSGSIWNEPRDWMMGLLKKERLLSAYWSPPEIVKLPDSIRSIGVETLPLLKTSEGYITITYEFNNFEACYDFINAKKNTNL